MIVNAPPGSDGATALLDEIARRPAIQHLPTIVIVPQLIATSAQTLPGRHLLPSPIRRAALYDLVAFATRRITARTAEAESAQNHAYTPPSAEEAQEAGALVLVAEDSKTNQFVIKNQLRHLGIACEVVNDGREAFEALTQNDGKYGLLLTDCHMPHIDGYRLTALIRDRELTTKRHLPVVALTANALSGEAEICRASGMDDYLSKPTNLEALTAIFRKWLPAAMALREERNQDTSKLRRKDTTKTASPAPIDVKALVNLAASEDETFARDMLTIYKDSEHEMAEKLVELIGAGNSVELRNAAHAAKGAARTVCATRLAELCEDLERASRLQDWKEAKLLGSQIDEETRRVMAFIDTYMKAPQPAP